MDAPTIHAWNADGFERLLWECVMEPVHGFPAVPIYKWRCTAYKARCNNLPNKLENAARCLNVSQLKDTRGRELIKLLCIPMADGTFLKDPRLLAEMDEYCLQDVRAEMAIDAQLREPSDEEWQDFITNMEVNDNGFCVDRELCIAAQRYALEEEQELIHRIKLLTEGACEKPRGEKLKAWVKKRLTPEQLDKVSHVEKGVTKVSLDKWNRFRLLGMEDLDPVTREVLECSDFAQKSSVSKFKAMSLIADLENDRVYGAILCNGASQSGRFSSRGAQVHNYPRECMDDSAQVRQDLVEDIEPDDITAHWQLPIMSILSRMLRSAIVPGDGSAFLVSDWSAIEGRVAPWLCKDDDRAERKLQLYRDGIDVYVRTAAETFGIDEEEVGPELRQIGKVQELALQYGGGRGAFMAFARNYGLDVEERDAESYKRAWREANPWAVSMWKKLEDRAALAILRPGAVYEVGRLKYFGYENILCGGTTLFCELPCGRLLTYPDARVEEDGITCMRAAWVPKATETEWPRMSLWGGLLFENAVQGAAASLLRYALRLAVSRGLYVSFHVHDELVVESFKGHEQADSAILHEIMNTPPPWCEDLPLKADVKIMERFGK
jgi:DNA polymerase